MSSDTPPPTGLVHRFTLFIEGLKRAMADGIRPREVTLTAMALPLWHYLSGTLRRLAALQARLEAGTLAPAPRHGGAPRRASDRPRRTRRPPCIPPGPVLLRYRLAHFLAPLRELVDDPEMRALLAASPQAGRLLRPLWRKLTTDPLPRATAPAAEPGRRANRRRRARPHCRPTRRPGRIRPLRASRRLRCPPGHRRCCGHDGAPPTHFRYVTNWQPAPLRVLALQLHSSDQMRFPG
jgi:hypothetical protein